MSGYQVAGFQLSHLLLAFVLAASFIFLLYWLWTWPCKDKDGSASDENKPILPKQTVKPIYALELEPGIVVLQSEDGEFFRILREYDSAEKRGKGLSKEEKSADYQEMMPLTRSQHGARHDEDEDSQLILPSYTQACYQTGPSAPPPPPVPSRSTSLPRPRGRGANPFGDGHPWMPIHTVNPD